MINGHTMTNLLFENIIPVPCDIVHISPRALTDVLNFETWLIYILDYVCCGGNKAQVPYLPVDIS